MDSKSSSADRTSGGADAEHDVPPATKERVSRFLSGGATLTIGILVILGIVALVVLALLTQ